MLYRLAAAIGLIAHAIDSLGNWVIGPLGLRFRIPFAVLLSIPLLASAVIGTISGVQQLESRAEPVATGVADLADADRFPQAYVTVEGLVHGEPLVDEVGMVDPDGFPIGSRTDFYYLVRDSDAADVAAIVRSRLDDAAFRRRELDARVVDDPAWIEAALGRLGAAAAEWQVELNRYLDEVASSQAPSGDPQSPRAAVAEATDGAVVRTAGALVSPSQVAACDASAGSGCTPDAGEGPFVYLLADPGTDAAVLLRSPHPPNAMPVEVTGLYLAATLDARRALEGDWIPGERDALRIPDRRVLYDGQEPPFTPPSFSGPVVGGSLGLLLLLSAGIGYPIFRRGRSAAVPPGGVPDPRALDGTFVSVSGRMPAHLGRPRLTDEIGQVRMLEPMEFELTRWRYGEAQSGATPKQLAAEAEAAGGEPRLALDIANQSALVPLLPRDGAWDAVTAGRLERLRRGRPALRLKGAGGLDIVVSFADDAERDRFGHALGAGGLA